MPNAIVELLLRQVADLSSRLSKLEAKMGWITWGIRALVGGVIVVILQNWLKK